VTQIYTDPNNKSHVYIDDPSGRLNLRTFSFPFTPNITTINSTNYTGYDLTHTNFQQRAFQSSNNVEIQITAPMIVRNEEEAHGVLSGAQFFRAAMKMGFGKNDPLKGLPPPVLQFNAYQVYKKVPILIRDFTWNFDADTDYVQSGSVHVPISSTFAISLMTTYSPKRVRDEFTVEQFAQGQLRSRGYI
jgi:hypothetical protein